MREVDTASESDASELVEAEVGRIFRDESGRSVATLIRLFGDIGLAEDAVQEAFAFALRRCAIVRACLAPHELGPYQLQAAINAVHARRRLGRSDRLVPDRRLYDQLVAVARRRTSR